MKVLHILPTRSPGYGGPVQVAESLASEINRLGGQAIIIPSGEKKKNPMYLPGRDAWREMKSLVPQQNMVHLHGLWTAPTALASGIARRRNIPYVVMPHGMLDRWSLARSRVKKKAYSFLIERRNIDGAAALHFLNDEELAEAREFGFDAPAFVLPNGIREDLFDKLPNREALDGLYPPIRGKLLALFLGRLHEKKGFELLVPAFSEARKIFPELHLLIAGPDEGGYEARLKTLLRQHKIIDAVTLLGMIQGEIKRTVLGGSDFFLLPSHQEGDSMAVKEAMASELPVLISPACHFPEVEQFEAGVIVELRVDDIVRGICLLTDKDRRRTLGENARNLILSRYVWSSIGSRLVVLYRDILEGRFTAPEWRLGFTP